MKTCPKCGGKNLQTAASCRLCATPLEPSEAMLGVRADLPVSDQLPATVIISGEKPGEHSEASFAEAGQVTCPTCGTVNQPDWVFCEQCGKPLSSAASESPQPSASAQQAPAREVHAEAFKEARANSARASEPKQATQPSSPPAALPQGPSSHTGYTTSLVCGTCGVIQPSGGQFCHGCGAALTPGAITKAKQPEPKKPELRKPEPKNLEPKRPEPRQREASKRAATLRLIAEGGEPGEAFSLNRSETVIGRAQGHLTFQHDGFMSGHHARIVERDGRYFLVDENSRNGTFIRIIDETELKPGDVFLVGKQVLKFDKP